MIASGAGSYASFQPAPQPGQRAAARGTRGFLAVGPAAATAPGGPHGWSPLLYQVYARHDPRVGLDATLQTTRLLLDAGADPNDGRFWHGLPTPFTVLTGVLSYGDHDQPWHPHSIPLTRLLLDAGADPNDGQALYNRMFGPNDDELESPAQMLRELRRWAVLHDQHDRVALLAAHGVDLSAPFTCGAPHPP